MAIDFVARDVGERALRAVAEFPTDEAASQQTLAARDESIQARAEAEAARDAVKPLSGIGPPAVDLGGLGAVYYDVADAQNIILYGPKTGGGWGAGRSLKGNPGAGALPVGPFSSVSTLVIPVGTDLIRTTGYATTNDGGGAFYRVGATTDAAAPVGRTSTNTANGRPVRLSTDQAVNVRMTGAVSNVDNDATGASNAAAFNAALSVASQVFVPGDPNTTFALAGTTVIVPQGKGLFGEGARLKVRDNNGWIDLNNDTKFRGISLVGMGFGNGATTFSLIRANTNKSNVEIYIPYLADAPKNGVQITSIVSRIKVVIDKAERFGGPGLITAYEGAIVYMTNGTDIDIHIGDGSGSWGSGAIITVFPTRVRISGYIHDTRYRAVSQGSGNPAGPGNRIFNFHAARMGSLATPDVAGNGIGTNGLYLQNVPNPDYFIVENVTIEDVGENFIEGCCTIINPRCWNNPGYDDHLLTPNPSGFFGRQKITGGSIKNPRGWGFKYSGETGTAVQDVEVSGLTITDPRPVNGSGILQIQAHNAVGARINIDNVTGIDTTGALTVGFSVGPSGSGTFTPNQVFVTNNKTNVAVNNINAAARSKNNSWDS